MAGDKRGLVGNEKQHAVGDFFGSAHTQQCLVAARQPGALLLCRVFVDGPTRGKSAETWRVDGARADAVYPYTVLSVVERHLPGQIDYGSLGRAVAGIFSRRQEPESRRGRHDVTAALFDEMR